MAVECLAYLLCRIEIDMVTKQLVAGLCIQSRQRDGSIPAGMVLKGTGGANTNHHAHVRINQTLEQGMYPCLMSRVYFLQFIYGNRI